MTNKFELSVISAESKVFEGEVENVLVPGMIGDFLVLPNHGPCISSIRPGFLEFCEDASKKHRYFVSGGMSDNIQCTQVFPTTFFASGSSIISTIDWASLGTFEKFIGIDMFLPPLNLSLIHI